MSPLYPCHASDSKPRQGRHNIARGRKPRELMATSICLLPHPSLLALPHAEPAGRDGDELAAPGLAKSQGYRPGLCCSALRAFTHSVCQRALSMFPWDCGKDEIHMSGEYGGEVFPGRSLAAGRRLLSKLWRREVCHCQVILENSLVRTRFSLILSVMTGQRKR